MQEKQKTRDQEKIVDDFLLEDKNFPLVMREYSTVIIKHPVTFLKVKLLDFSRLLGAEDTFYWFYGTIDGNPYHFNLNEQFASFRAWYIAQFLRCIKPNSYDGFQAFILFGLFVTWYYLLLLLAGFY